jgi:integrase
MPDAATQEQNQIQGHGQVGKKVALRKLKLTDAIVSRLPIPTGSALLYWDTQQRGLAVRVSKGGTRRFMVQYRRAGAGRAEPAQSVTLTAATNVAEARKAAAAVLGGVAQGQDPAQLQRENKRVERAVVSALLDSYEADLSRRRYVNALTAMSILLRVLKGWTGRDIKTMTRQDAVNLVEQSTNQSDARKHLTGLLNYAVHKGMIPANPLSGWRKMRATNAERLAKAAHGRALSDDEIRAVWAAASPGTAFGRMVRALILTGTRRGEMAGLEWSMIRTDRIVIPPSHTKMAREHVVPLTDALRDVLAACPKTKATLVFPSARTNRAMSGWFKLVAKIEAAAAVKFDLHDLRRTFRSGLTRLGIGTELAEVCLGHQRSELLEIYDKADRWDERAAAFTLWAEHVQRVVALGAGPDGSATTGNVVDIAMTRRPHGKAAA